VTPTIPSTTIGKQLKQKREMMMSTNSDYSQENISQRLGKGFSQPTLSKLERGTKQPQEIHPRELMKLLEAYGFNALEIAELNKKFDLGLISSQPHLATFKTDTAVAVGQAINVYGAGTGPAWDLDDIVETIGIPETIYPEKDKIGLKAMSDSMAPYLPKGAVAIVVLDDGLVQPGDYCGVWLHGDGVVVKRFVNELESGEFLLESLNPDPGEDRIFLAPLGSRIMGKVVKRVLDG
jgi:phage repressor protein C with HTH and peptisase S24 domain